VVTPSRSSVTSHGYIDDRDCSRREREPQRAASAVSDKQRDPDNDRGYADRQREQPRRVILAAGGIIEIDVHVAVADEMQ
jgi:hypothetical protein